MNRTKQVIYTLEVQAECTPYGHALICAVLRNTARGLDSRPDGKVKAVLYMVDAASKHKPPAKDNT